ncbi:transcriptional repressor [Rhodoblastus acidophilus]|uniref:Transcriptional repressor n=1 Tax=Candidatus Rhodoblastus alkanivorans TaxID=2954117 RepID=A0ABS9ZCE0_9HYPH|nr:Fur family transcriptional regulator [Candidatus Rhodoblastus alkanivorans]MCI4680049.1 transcriptional repressor [Candidatus Rhodoblastus alkanivorans]MCI4684797.1 transcriptional repressor [Candidatus Rhodoblastus alkanivorans]MDI4642121.1 transcriptional repressor [Rhodoblastus acidophilus]
MEKRDSASRARRASERGAKGGGAVYAATAAGADLSGCPLHDLRRKLSEAGLRPTRQRLRLGWLLFGGGDRHVTAERLYDEARAARAPISLATVYNTLNQFTSAGLLKEVTVDGAKTYFDTNLAEHQHFVIDDETHMLTDLPKELIDFTRLPEPPEGMEIARVDVMIRLRRKAS